MPLPVSANFTAISAKLKALVTTVQVASSSAFVDVLENPPEAGGFTGFPSATIIPADVQSAYATVQQNARVYGFYIYIYYELEGSGDSTPNATAFSNMRTLVDGVLDAIERSVDLGGVCDILKPVPMAWYEQDTATGLALVAPIHVMAQKDVAIF